MRQSAMPLPRLTMRCVGSHRPIDPRRNRGVQKICIPVRPSVGISLRQRSLSRKMHLKYVTTAKCKRTLGVPLADALNPKNATPTV